MTNFAKIFQILGKEGLWRSKNHARGEQILRFTVGCVRSTAKWVRKGMREDILASGLETSICVC